MTGLESIIEQINQKAAAAADETLSKAQAQADALLDDARARAGETARETAAAAQADEKAILDAAKAAGALAHRRALLKARVELINSVLDDARRALDALDDAAYFDLICKTAVRYCVAGSGRIAFNARDLARMPAGFEKRLNDALSGKNAALTVAKEAADIDGGFVLLYDGVEENCSFDALFYSERDRLQDAVGALLFG